MPEGSSKLKIKKALKFTAFAVVIIAAAAGGVMFYNSKKKSSSSELIKQVSMVKTGKINVSISGSGTVESESGIDVYSKIGSYITGIFHKEGDVVKKGDVIMTLSDNNLTSNGSSSLKQSVTTIQNSIEEAQLTYNTSKKNLQNTQISTPISGEVSGVTIKEGQQISANTTIATLTDKSKLKMTAVFTNAYRKSIKPGQSVTVNAFDTTLENSYNLNGTVSSVSSPVYKTSAGTETYNVEVLINNSGSLKESLVAKAKITIGGTSYESNDSSTLSYKDSYDVKALSSGTVKKLYVSNGQYVNKGTLLVSLDSDDLVNNLKNSEIKLKELKDQLSTAQKLLSYCTITAPTDGVLSLQSLKVNQTVSENTLLCSIINKSDMEFPVSIDELDIAKIKKGQAVKVSIDALSETSSTPLSGTVVKVMELGSTSSGVTTYPVYVKINETSKLKTGMNANAVIQIVNKENVLTVPVDAVQKVNGKSIVWVLNNQKPTSSSSQNISSSDSVTYSKITGNTSKDLNKYYASATAVTVTTGLSDSKNIEIKSGLTNGQMILLPPVYSSSTSTSTTSSSSKNSMGGGMGGDMGGGPPDGGGPPSSGGSSSSKK